MMLVTAGMIGAGKALDDKELIPTIKEGNIVFKENGDLKVGDYVINRKGKAVKVTGVFPQGLQDAYKVKFSNGSEVVCNNKHLWTYITSKGNYKTETLQYFIDNGYLNNRKQPVIKIPINEGIELSEKTYKLSPYVLGALIGDGCLTERILTISSDDEEVISRVAKEIGAYDYVKLSHDNYNWHFMLPEKQGRKIKFQTKDVIPELVGKKSFEKYIPEEYLNGSEQQRWDLVQGLFDTDGCASKTKSGSITVSFSTSSERLAVQLKGLLKTLGVDSTLSIRKKENQKTATRDNFQLKVQGSYEDKEKCFSLRRKKSVVSNREKIGRYKYESTTIKEIVKLNKQVPMTCIMVDDEEHLYCATKDYIVTHNTTITNIIAETFGTQAFFEEVDDNPILDKFYEDPEKWAFSLQIYFLNKRFKAIKQALSDDNNVLDRSIYEDALFTQINNEQGNISDVDMRIYNELLDNMMEELKGLPKKAPDLLIYLDADFDTILEHIKTRGREYEQCDNDPELLEYYRTLWEHYSEWYENYNYSPKMKIKVESYNPKDENSVFSVMTQIALKLFEVRFSDGKALVNGKECTVELEPKNIVKVKYFDEVKYYHIQEFISKAEVLA